MSRAFAAQLASDQSQVRDQNSLKIESKLCVELGQMARTTGLTEARNCQMWMKGALLAGKASFCASSIQSLVKQGEMARRIFNSDPEHSGLTVKWK